MVFISYDKLELPLCSSEHLPLVSPIDADEFHTHLSSSCTFDACSRIGLRLHPEPMAWMDHGVFVTDLAGGLIEADKLKLM